MGRGSWRDVCSTVFACSGMSAIQRISDQASVSVAGEATDPCHVIVGPAAREAAQQDIEIEIDERVVLHELRECGVAVTEDSLRDFVAGDALSEKGREAYITFARFIMRPLPPLSGLRHTITPKWSWVETTNVTVDSGVVRLKGRANPV
mgnify:CR=1 FL=1